MATSKSSPTPVTYLVITDSHGKNVPTVINTSSYTIIVRAISGLQWVDSYKSQLSAVDLLSTPIIDSYLSSAKALMLLIGTNSVRCTPAPAILTQIKTFINSLRSRFAHLSAKHCINIIPCFPCFKPLYPLNTYHSLLNNIAQYNNQLVNLSIELNFTIVDFNVKDYHIGVDKMHIDSYYKTLVTKSIVSYFEYLSSTLTVIPVKPIGRSREAKARRNKRRHIKLSLKQQQFYLTRPVESPWSLKSIKPYLDQQKFKFAKIPPIFRNTLRIQFNNSIDLQTAEATLSQDAFSQQSYLQ
jgi:hypothetical protein